jgi:tetratricopeptide (TPR) repeat protein
LVLLTVAVAALMWRRAQKSEARALMKGAEDAAAFELYQRGRALWQTRNGEKLHEATTLLEQAVRQDPNFALAHSALADAYAFDYTNWKRAEGAAREDMRLDPKLGEPHAAVGFVKMFWEWKLREAEAEFKQALQLNPHYATAHQWHAALLAATCRLDAAYAEMSQALGLEPDSPAVNADMCQTLYFMRRYDEALAQCRKTLDANPDFFNAHRYLYEIYAANGMFDEAVAQHFKTEEAAGVKMPPAVNEKLRQAYASGGIRAFWRLRIEALAAGNAPLRYQLAQNYARLGDTEAALKWLREAYEKRDVEFLLFYADPAFDNLRHDPRYQNLMALLFPLN